MTNRYLYITLLAILGFNADMMAQQGRAKEPPRLVVDITIDQLRSDYLEAFAPLYGESGFKRLLSQGRVFTNATFPFVPVDRASAIASIQTGTTPYYHNIIGLQWINRETLRPTHCVDDARYPGLLSSQSASPMEMATSTLGDELKLATDGKGQVYAIAPFRDAAVLSAGHAANLALWIDHEYGNWCSSQFYAKTVPTWLRNYTRTHTQAKAGERANNDVTELAQYCISSQYLGQDDFTDLLCLTYAASPQQEAMQSSSQDMTNWQTALQDTYVQIDSNLSQLIDFIDQKVGLKNVLVVISGTGHSAQLPIDYEKYRIPTGNFYINRTANLLNMYLGAIWGQGQYVETTFHNQVFLNHKLLETRKINLAEAQNRSQEIVAMMDGVRNVYTSLQLLTNQTLQTEKMRQAFHPKKCGDLIIEITPGWSIVNEDTGQYELPSASFTPFPIIIFGANVTAERLSEPVTTDRIAPTIANAIHIRAPNACTQQPLSF